MVRTFVTPGGHRRFSRAGLEALLPERPTSRPSLIDLGETPGRMARGYRRAAEAGPGTSRGSTTSTRPSASASAAYGRGIVIALVAALDADDQSRRQELLRDAEDACTEYGRIAGREGLASATTADLFLRFRRPFLTELGSLARRREFDAAGTAALIADANAALDGLLLATLRGWEAAAMGMSRQARPARSRDPVVIDQAVALDTDTTDATHAEDGRAVGLGLVALVAHARRVPSEEREAFGDAAAALAGDPRAILLRTCHRVELYAIDEPAHGLPPLALPDLPDGARRLEGSAAARHVFTVAAGLDSVVVGEDQILHQLRECLSDRRVPARRAVSRWTSGRTAPRRTGLHPASSSACSRSPSTSAARRARGARGRRARSATSRSTASPR